MEDITSNVLPIGLRSGQSRHILVVEDDDCSAFFLQTWLKKRGYRTLRACNGKRAIEMLSCEHFDAVLMDVQMPVMNGNEATRRIREGEAGEANRDIIIIGVSANCFPSSIAKSMNEGMTAFLPKPVNIAKLDNMLTETCTEVEHVEVALAS